MNRPKTVHPFPARMAPELALEVLAHLPEGSQIVDPMCGSGTVLRYAQELRHSATGADLDPLAVLMARVWTQPVDADATMAEARRVVSEASELDPDVAHLHWIDTDAETSKFVQFWFAEQQARDLRRLAFVLREQSGTTGDLLRLALSRIVVTKERGASLARDVSHSRPHRVADKNDFDVLQGFVSAASRIISAVDFSSGSQPARVLMEDARVLHGVKSSSVDCVLTSPPYLNAIDYLRGHKLALVWLGYSISELRSIRSTSVGAERKLDGVSCTRAVDEICSNLAWYQLLDSRFQGIFDRYVSDLLRSMKQAARILKPGGLAVFVIGNSTVRGVYVENSEALKAAAKEHDLILVSETQREIPPNSRYLPPPSSTNSPDLSRRMRKEVVIRYRRAE